MRPTKSQGFLLTACAFQIVCLIFYAAHFDTSHAKNTTATPSIDPARLHGVYAMYMDVHVMIFVGFGFLMTYLRRYSLSAVSLNFVVAVLSAQWGIICVKMAHQIGDNDGFPRIVIDAPTLINADFAAGAVLISFGAVLGKVTPTQLLWMSFFEVIVYALNEYVLTEVLEVIDAGGSMVIHTFGAFFGLALSLQMGVPAPIKQTHNTSRYTSDIFAMIGTLFLWMYWPSFNAALVPPEGFRQERAVVNTLLSIAASCAATFAFSVVLSHNKKFDMVHLQNATLAGGVAMGATCELAINPASAATIGIVAGVVSVSGYCFLMPALERRMKLSDTAGILNLHGMPGVIGGLACAFASMAVSDDYYGSSLTDIYRARKHRTAGQQGGYQLLAVVVSVGIAVVAGVIVGRFLRSPLFIQQQMMYEDDEWFGVPDSGAAKMEVFGDGKSLHGRSRVVEASDHYIAVQTE
jgi:ammonium transporter Rh